MFFVLVVLSLLSQVAQVGILMYLFLLWSKIGRRLEHVEVILLTLYHLKIAEPETSVVGVPIARPVAS